MIGLPHSGNWDAAAVWLVDWLGGPFMTVAERLKPESLYERFVAYRESLGIRVVPLTGGPRPSSELLREWVSDGGVVCLLVDRDLGRTGTPVTFFGRAATLPTGPAVLAAQTGAALVPVVCAFTDTGWSVRFCPRSRSRAGPAAGPGGHRHAGRGRRLHRRHRRAARGLAACSAGSGPTCPPTRRRGGARLMRIGLVCPYQWDVPGGVQYHVRDLAETLRGLGHHVEVLTPAEREESLPAEYVTWAGRTVPVPYNGSMASVQFGPVSAARVRRWLRDGHFDVVHVHEPASPSVSLLVCMIATGPMVATFHAATIRSKWLAALGPWARPWLERISGRIAVSDFARRVQVEHLGGDAVIIPNGVHVAAFADGPTLPGHPRRRRPHDRFPRPVRRAAQGPAGAARGHAHRRPQAPGGAADHRRPGDGRGPELIGTDLQAHVALLGELSEADKAAFLRSVDVYCAPNLLGESFGVILIEALAAGAPIVASDLDAFARVLEHGEAGVLVRRGDPTALAGALCELLADPARRAELSARGSEVAAGYDWDVLARRILAVYETVVLPDGGEVTAEDDDDFPEDAPDRRLVVLPPSGQQ